MRTHSITTLSTALKGTVALKPRSLISCRLSELQPAATARLGSPPQQKEPSVPHLWVHDRNALFPEWHSLAWLMELLVPQNSRLETQMQRGGEGYLASYNNPLGPMQSPTCLAAPTKDSRRRSDSLVWQCALPSAVSTTPLQCRCRVVYHAAVPHARRRGHPRRRAAAALEDGIHRRHE